MAPKAAVLIDLTATDASPQLEATAAAARGAATAARSTEDATKAARAELRAIAKESALSERAFRDLAKAADLIGVDAAAGLVTVAHGSERTRKALDRLEAQAKQTDRAMDGIGKRFGDVGGDLARFGGQMDVLGDTGRPITLLGDAIELLSSPLGAAVGLTAAWGAAMGGTIAGAVALVAASDDLIDRLDAVGRTEVITPAQLAQLDAARGAITSVGDAWAEVGLILAAEFGPAVEAGANIAIGATFRVADAVEWLASKTDILTGALDILTGGSLTQARTALDLLGVDIAGPGGLVDSLQQEGEAYAKAATEARKSAEATKEAARAHVAAARQIRDASDIQFGSGLGAGFSSSEVLPTSLKADLSAFIAGSDFLAAGLAALATPAEQAAAAFDAQIERIHAAVQATGDLTSGMILLGAAIEDRAAAERSARALAAAGAVQGLAGVAGGDIGGALSLAGPGGMIAATLVELGPDSAEMLDERLSAIGENIIKLPETLAKLLATLVGFGADSRGEGIGRALGLAAGIGAALALPGVGLVAGAGIAAGSAAAGGAVGASLSREERRERRDRRDRPRVIVNGVATAEAVRVLDREARTIGGPRGRRYRLDRE